MSKNKIILSLSVLALPILVIAQSKDSLKLNPDFVPEWKLNSFGFSIRTMGQNYLSEYTIQDARNNAAEITTGTEYLYDTDSLNLYTVSSLKGTNVQWVDAQPKGFTVNMSWKQKEKPNEVRLSLFMYDMNYQVTYRHAWQVAPDTMGAVVRRFKEDFTLVGANLQYVKFTKPILKKHLRFYGGAGIELASDFGAMTSQERQVVYFETTDSIDIKYAGRGSLPFTLPNSFNSSDVSSYVGTKGRIYGGLNILVGGELLLWKKIKFSKEYFSLFYEYGLGVDGEYTFGGSKQARWTQQMRFGFRYFLK